MNNSLGKACIGASYSNNEVVRVPAVNTLNFICDLRAVGPSPRVLEVHDFVWNFLPAL